MTEDTTQDLIRTLRTEAVEDFLKTVYKLQRVYDPVPTTMLATELGIKPPSVTEMAKKLADHGLLEYARYRGLRLTESGRHIALEVIRHHRLLEMYLTEALGYSWDEVHDEAERLEHVISEQFEARIAAALGDPAQDPHGDPIPALDGSLPPSPDFRSLADLELTQPAIVCRITNQTPDVLRYLAERGLVLGAQVEVTAREPFNGPLHLLVEDNTAVVSHDIAAVILLSPHREHA